VSLERTAAAIVHDASGRSDVCVAERGYVLLQEIEQAPFTLEQREQLQSTVSGGFARRWSSHGRRELRRGRLGVERGRSITRRAGGEHSRRESAVEQDAEPTNPTEP
jgi:hypothetical protein